MNIINFKHSGNAGDVIYALPNIKAFCERESAKATIFLKLNVPSNFTDETHPVGNVMLNESMANMLKPLLMSQDYINNVIIYDKENIPIIDFDLDSFRTDYVNLSAGNISQWIGNSYPSLRPNLFEPSIILPKTNENYIIVNRTHRYNNIYIDYSILENYENVYFVGTEKEFKSLGSHNPNITHLVVNDFLELAKWIAGCKCFIGNQSMAFAIAEQLKVTRILEQFVYAPNVIPQGGQYYVAHNMKQFQNCIYYSIGYGKNSDSNKAEDFKTETNNG